MQTTIETALLHGNATFVATFEPHEECDSIGLFVPIFGRSRFLLTEFSPGKNDIRVLSNISTPKDSLTRMNLSTIISLAYNLCQYQGRHQIVRADGIVRFFARYLSPSKSIDAVLSQLKPTDLTRLLWVCAKMMSPPSTVYASECREASKHVARRIIHYLNNQKNSPNFFEGMNATYLAKFCWSLAKLGVHLDQDRSGRKSWYCHEIPLPPETDLGVLSLSELSNLVSAAKSRERHDFA